MHINQENVWRLEKAALYTLWGTIASVSFSNSFFEIFSSFFIGFSLILFFKKREGSFFRSLWFYAAFLFLLINFLSIFVSMDAWSSLRGCFRTFRCVLISFSTVFIINSPQLFKRTYHFFTAVLLLCLMDSIAQKFLGFDLVCLRRMTPYTAEIGRVTGPFHHANDYAAFLSLSLFLVFSVLVFSRGLLSKKEVVFYGLASLLGMISLLWTYARGAWISVIAGMVLLSFWHQKRKMLVSIFIILMALFIFSPPSIKGRVYSLGNWKDGTMTERRLLWGESLDMIKARPWFGFGANTYSKVEPGFKSHENKTDFQYAHNGYLQIGAEIGLVGLVSFLMMILIFFRSVLPPLCANRLSELGTKGLALAAGTASFLLHSATDTNLQSLRLVAMFWIAMGICYSSVLILRDSKS